MLKCICILVKYDIEWDIIYGNFRWVFILIYFICVYGLKMNKISYN